jgi:hypothetical protein
MSIASLLCTVPASNENRVLYIYIINNARARVHFADGSIKVLAKFYSKKTWTILSAKLADKKCGQKRATNAYRYIIGTLFPPAGMSNILIHHEHGNDYDVRVLYSLQKIDCTHTLCRHGTSTDRRSLVNINDTIIIFHRKRNLNL